MKKIAILVTTYTDYDFLVEPLIKLIKRFWHNHPPIFITGTNKSFQHDTITISVEQQQLKSWVTNYHEALKFLHKQGFDAFYLILDDLHPLGSCDADYLNQYLPQKAEEYNAGYVYLMSHFNMLETSECQHSEWLRLVAKNPYCISLQVGYWCLEYALAITEQIKQEGIQSIWAYEVQGSLLNFREQRSNYILKQGTRCQLPQSSLDKLSKEVAWHISSTPYPFVRGGLLYQGRSTPITRQLYREFLGEFSEVKRMLEYTNSFKYLNLDFRRRVRRKLQAWNLLLAR